MIYLEPEGFQSNCYILEGASHAFVLDPGVDAAGIIKVLENRKINSVSVILTHSHVDHWAGAPQLLTKTGAKVYMGLSAKDVCYRPEVNLAYMADLEFPEVSGWLSDGEIVEKGGVKLKIIFTPGHTACGISVATDEGLFTGDSIFASGRGRTDLPGGDDKTLMCSIRERILSYPPSTKLFPGHGPFTSVAAEKKLYV